LARSQSLSRRGSALALLAMLALLPTGCTSWRAITLPLDQIDLDRGYRPETILGGRNLGDVALIVTFSGGGTRAAALAYGVLEELRDTQIVVDGTPTRLLDEIDIISSVSGGSFTSAYYGLHGDGLFEDFKERFLELDVERGLLLRMLNPKNLFRLTFPFFDRTSLAIDYYEDKIFDRLLFSDLEVAGGPLIQINSTDLSAGSQFTFQQAQFDLLCSDLSALSIARAVTASSAVPIVFPAITIENRAGSCGYQKPEWMVEGLASRIEEPRRFQIASEAAAYLDPEETPYVHLVDGGIADNLGVRGPLDNVIGRGGIARLLEQLGVERPHHMAFIVVDSSTKPERSFVSLPGAPSIAALLGSITDTQIHRYNFETLALLDESMKRFAEELSTESQPLNPHMILVAESQIEDPDDRGFFDDVPTSLSLDQETVTRLIQIGRRMLRESAEFQALVTELGGTLGRK